MAVLTSKRALLPTADRISPLDKLDIAIIRELTQAGLILPGRPGFEPSYREIAKKLGVPFGTVRNRISGMYRSGVLKGSTIFPNPNLFGLKAGALTMDLARSGKKSDAIEKLKQVPGVGFVHDFLGTKAWTVFVYTDETDLQSKLERFRAIAGGAEGVFSRIPYPPCPPSVSPEEAALISQLARKGLKSYAELSSELGVPIRTLKRRMSSLVQQRAILSLPLVNYHSIEGCVPADLLIFFKDQEARAYGEPKILQLVKDYAILAGLFDIVGMCSLIVPKLASLRDLEDQVSQIEGVRKVWVEIVDRHIDQVYAFEAYLEKPQMARKKKLSKNAKNS